MMTLTAPSHLRGRMSKHAPMSLRYERHEWVRARVAEGYKQCVIAAALGINQASLHSLLRRANIVRNRPEMKATGLAYLGVRLGRMGDAFDSLPMDMRDAMVSEASRTGASISDIFVRLAKEASHANC